MTLADVLMLGVAVIGGAAALLLVTSRNVVHAALFLVIALLSVAGTFLVIGAEFLAWTQVLINVGAVVVLILFGLMLTRAPIGPMAQRNDNAPLALLASVGLFAFLVFLIFDAFAGKTVPTTHVTAADLGSVLYTDWAFPLMALGFLLTVALIGAIVIARSEEGEGPVPPEEDRAQGSAREPVPTDASSTPGVTSATEEVVS